MMSILIAEQPEVQEVCWVCSSQSCSCSKTASGVKGMPSSFLSLYGFSYCLLLSDQGTVFIPTNEAFKLLSGDKMEKAISADLDRWLFNFFDHQNFLRSPSSFLIINDHCPHLFMIKTILTIVIKTIMKIWPHCTQQDSWTPLPGPECAVRRHSDTSTSGRCWGQFRI